MRRLVVILSGLAIAVLIWFNYASLIEAFGSGPPYYSRSTNMDKWSNPLPLLIPLDIIICTAVYLLLRRRRAKH